MSIHTRTIHRVEVRIPDEVWDRYNETAEYVTLLSRATELSTDFGSYEVDHIEWAEFPGISEAMACHRKLEHMVAHFQGKLIIDKKEEENE